LYIPFLRLGVYLFSSKERALTLPGSLDKIYSYEVKKLLYVTVIRNTFIQRPRITSRCAVSLGNVSLYALIQTMDSAPKSFRWLRK
jgi:hypothetical protein